MENCSPNTNSNQADILALSSKSIKNQLGLRKDYLLISTQALIRGYIIRNRTTQNKSRQRLEIAYNFQSFKAYFNKMISIRVYKVLEINGMHFKAENVKASWILPSARGVNKIYFGEIDESRVPHGQGIEICLSQDYKHGIYEGEWYNGQKHGKGRLIIYPGDLYDGDWLNGKKHGKGYSCYHDGNCYEGDWKNNECEGFGHSWDAQGSNWEGSFLLGNPHGLLRNWGENYSFYGYFKNGCRNGKGWMKFSNGYEYIGNFINNKANGKCTIKSPDGMHFKGNVVNFIKTGPGVIVDKSVGVYKGEFNNGAAEGDFVLTTNSGEKKKFIAVQGRLTSLSIMDEILENLFLGSAEAAQDEKELKNKGIKNIVRVLHNENVQKLSDMNYHIISLKDSDSENMSIHFSEAIKFIHTSLLANEKVLVHCYKGVSRSPTIVIAYIMALQKCDLASALKLVRQKRPLVYPNSGFIKQLEEFDFNSLSL